MTDFSPAYAPCSACSALVLFEGKRRQRQQGEQWKLLVPPPCLETQPGAHQR